MTDLKVVPFTGETTVDMPAEKVLGEAVKAGLSHCLVVGLQGSELYFAGTTSDTALILHLLKEATEGVYAALVKEVEKELKRSFQND